eukprot:4359615-Pyramimonas_sp.AAC.3
MLEAIGGNVVVLLARGKHVRAHPSIAAELRISVPSATQAQAGSLGVASNQVERALPPLRAFEFARSASRLAGERVSR